MNFMKNKQQHIKGMFKELGLLSSEYDFENIIPNSNFRNEVSKFNTEASNILKFSPELFVMPSSIRGNEEEKIKIVKNNIFFVKIITDLKFSKEELEIYEKYYKNTKVMILYLDFNKKSLFLDNFSNLKTRGKIKSPKQNIIDFVYNMNLSKSRDEVKEIVSKWNNLIFK